jgi:hypothetical protein
MAFPFSVDVLDKQHNIVREKRNVIILGLVAALLLCGAGWQPAADW